jgi:Immunoglobulin-like domain of bacterial spore germination/Sporulation and spore germination
VRWHTETPVTRRLVLVLLPLLTAACGGGTSASGTRTGTVTTAPAADRVSVVAYFLRAGRVAPARVTVDRTDGVAPAVLRELSGPPPQGYTTAVPAPGDVEVRIDSGVAKVRSDRGTLSHEAAAQVVYTLTALRSIHAVELADGTLARRAAFEDVVPPILIEAPLPGDNVRSPIRVAGTASVYEATLVVELVQGGDVLQRKTVTASTGAPERGTFSTSFETAATGDASIVAFAPSAADGSEQHRVEVPIQIAG